MSDQVELEAQVPAEMYGLRLDQAVTQLFPDYSRSRLQGWIKEGALTVDGEPRRPRDKLGGGEMIRVAAQLERIEEHRAQEIPLDIIHEDEHILVVNKPAGLVVHPAAGHPMVPCSMHCSTTVRRSPRCREPGSCTDWIGIPPA